MEYNRFCFHGTHMSKVEGILTDGFNHSQGEADEIYLGKGIYFMEEDREAAFRFCTGVHKIPREEVRVIKTKIVSHDYLNLIDTKEYDDFVEFGNELSKILIQEGKAVNLTPGIILNYIYDNIDQFDLVRHSFGLPWRVRNQYGAVYRHNIYICVRNNSCISIIDEENNNGKISKSIGAFKRNAGKGGS